MKQHDPIKLSPAERSDLGSITRHPGMAVVDKILAEHVQKALEQVHEVQPDDPDRTTKLDGIGSVAFAMKMTLELLRKEIHRNWQILQQEEEAAKNESEKTK
jgi:hypothetical protein